MSPGPRNPAHKYKNCYLRDMKLPVTVHWVPEQYIYYTYTWPWKTIILRLYGNVMPVHGSGALPQPKPRNKRNGEHHGTRLAIRPHFSLLFVGAFGASRPCF